MPIPNHKTWRRAGVGLGLALAASGVFAQAGGTTPQDRQVDEAFRASFSDPGDIGAQGRYAQLLLQAGNYEGAIATLERALVEPGAPPRLRVDIAALYARLQSWAMAEAMLDQALADPSLQGADRQLAETLKADIARRSLRSQWSGSLLAGVRHDSNATYRTGAAQVYASGALVPRAAGTAPESDTAVVLSARINHEYDLELNRRASITTSFGATVVDQNGSSGSQLTAGFNRPYDIGILDLTTGVTFSPMIDNQDALSLRPHVIFSQVWAQQHRFVDSAGVGLDASWRINPLTVLDATADWQHRSYETRVDLPGAPQLEGHQAGVRARLSYDLGGGQSLAGELGLRRNSAASAIFSWDSIDVRASYTIAYAPPMALGSGNWSTTFSAGTLHRSYDAADPAVLAGSARRDREWRIGVQQAIPLAPRWLALFSLDYSRNNANLPNFDFRNTSVQASVLRTF